MEKSSKYNTGSNAANTANVGNVVPLLKPDSKEFIPWEKEKNEGTEVFLFSPIAIAVVTVHDISSILTYEGQEALSYQVKWVDSEGHLKFLSVPGNWLRPLNEAQNYNPTEEIYVNFATEEKLSKFILVLACQDPAGLIMQNLCDGYTQSGDTPRELAILELLKRSQKITQQILEEKSLNKFSSSNDFEARMSAKYPLFRWDCLSEFLNFAQKRKLSIAGKELEVNQVEISVPMNSDRVSSFDIVAQDQHFIQSLFKSPKFAVITGGKSSSSSLLSKSASVSSSAPPKNPA